MSAFEGPADTILKGVKSNVQSRAFFLSARHKVPIAANLLGLMLLASKV